MDEGSKENFERTTCIKCGKICKSNQGLSRHQNTCFKSVEKGASFFRNEKFNLNHITFLKEGSSVQKVLPMSQPLSDESQSNRRSANNTSDHVNVDSKEEDTNAECPMCRLCIQEDENAVICDTCRNLFHQECLHMTNEEYLTLENNDTIKWFCARCKSIKANNIKWGEHIGEIPIRDITEKTYKSIIGWKKNIFPLPRGKCGSEFIKELTRLINLFVNKTKWQRVAMSMIHIFIPIMLQKPSAKSKPRDHAKYLTSRLERWSNGDLKSLMEETCEIQKRLLSGKMKTSKEKAKQRLFVQLMLLGKIGEASKKINNDDEIKGVHQLTDDIKEILQEKHPKCRPVNPDIIIQDSNISNQPVIFEMITSDLVERVARNMRGSGGPSQIDSEVWKNILCAKVYGKASTDLRQSIADLAKMLATEQIHPDCLTEFTACRLVPLDKGITKEGGPGVRPVGVGEVMRRIVGKLVLSVIKDDISKAAGPLQTCTGVKSGIEAAIHSMREIFEKDETEAVLLVDAENAFNNLNRSAALKNIKVLCPPFHQYLQNTYQKPAQLIIQGDKEYEIILSEEGTTQGDVTAMGKYGLATKPLVDKLDSVIDNQCCKQVWYADDSSSAGELVEIKKNGGMSYVKLVQISVTTH